jgi:hypothetical protein
MQNFKFLLSCFTIALAMCCLLWLGANLLIGQPVFNPFARISVTLKSECGWSLTLPACQAPIPDGYRLAQNPHTGKYVVQQLESGHWLYPLVTREGGLPPFAALDPEESFDDSCGAKNYLFIYILRLQKVQEEKQEEQNLNDFKPMALDTIRPLSNWVDHANDSIINEADSTFAKMDTSVLSGFLKHKFITVPKRHKKAVKKPTIAEYDIPEERTGYNLRPFLSLNPTS